MSDALTQLFEEAREETAPPAGAEERVLAGVLGAAAVGATVGAAATTATKVGLSATAKKIVGVLLLLGGTGVGLGLVVTGKPVSQTARSLRASLPDVDTRPPQGRTELEVPTVATAEGTDDEPPRPAPSVGAPSTPPPSDADDLAAEIALLAKARAALRSGDGSAAMARLDEHARRFPRGTLAPERTVTRVRALCALGGPSAARAAYLRLAGGDPHSPHLASLRAACPGMVSEP